MDGSHQGESDGAGPGHIYWITIAIPRLCLSAHESLRDMWVETSKHQTFVVPCHMKINWFTSCPNHVLRKISVLIYILDVGNL